MTAAGRLAGQARRIVAAILLLAAIALVWPVYGWFAAAQPQILGLPLSMAWVVLWLLVVFAALLWLYRCDAALEAAADRAGSTP